MVNDNSLNNSSSNFNLAEEQLPMITHHEKALVEKGTDTSLPEEPKSEVVALQSVSSTNIKSQEEMEMDAFLD